MDLTILKKVGLSNKEISIYLNLLEHGACSVRGLAELSDLNRGTVYDVLKKLREEGIVSFYEQGRKQKFAAEDPEKLLKLLKDKENELKSLKADMAGFIPELKSLREKGGSAPATKFYERRSGIRLILEDVLESVSREENKEYSVYSAKRASDDIIRAYPDFTEDRIKKGISVKAISLARGGKTSGKDERRWLGTDEESATFIIVYAGKCAFISRDSSGNPVGVIIENRMIYETQKVIFEKLWDKLA